MTARTGLSGLDVALIAASIIVIILGVVFVLMAHTGTHASNHTTTTTETTTTSTTNTTSTNSTTTTNTTTTKETWG
jgi:hypothetical protein